MSIEQEQTFVLTEDTRGIWQRVSQNVSGNLPGLDSYYNEVSKIIESELSKNGISFKAFREETIESALTRKVEGVLENDNEVICLCLDRYLLSTIEVDPNFGERFFRIDICRDVNGNRIARQGSKDLDLQINDLQLKFPNISDLKILIVDDGVFSGGTIIFISELLKQIGVRKDQLEVLGFIGNNAREKLVKEGIKTEVMVEVGNLYDWVDLRDFGVFGGKTLQKSKSGAFSISIPYLFPWSMGEGASFDKFGGFFTLSYQIIESQIRMLSSWENELKKLITFRDLSSRGFPFPTNSQKNIKPSINTRVIDFLTNCQALIKKEQEREVTIFDMDGTLYLLNGINSGFSGSTLESKVLKNALSFIIERENCSTEGAEKIRREGLEDPIGLSAFLSRRYQISREDYFNKVWDIEPENIITNFEIPVKVIKKLASTNKKLILLTSAPKIWQQRIFSYLGLENAFEAIYTAESYGNKGEVFKILSQRYNPEKITSVGDQEKTDLLPAKQVGIKGLLVNHPEDLAKLLENDL